MQHMRGIWFAVQADPDPEVVGEMIRQALTAISPDMICEVTARLPNGTLVAEEGMVYTSTDHLRFTPTDDAGESMSGFTRLIPWENVESVVIL